MSAITKYDAAKLICAGSRDEEICKTCDGKGWVWVPVTSVWDDLPPDQAQPEACPECARRKKSS